MDGVTHFPCFCWHLALSHFPAWFSESQQISLCPEQLQPVQSRLTKCQWFPFLFWSACFGNLYSWRKSGSDSFPVSFPTCILWVIIFPCSQAASLPAVSLLERFLPFFWIPRRDAEQWGKDFSGRFEAELWLRAQSLSKEKERKKREKEMCEKDHKIC